MMRLIIFSITFCIVLCSCNNIEINKTASNIDIASLQTEKPIKNLKLKADSFYENNNYLEALKYFDTLINKDSTNGEYFYKRGYSYGMLLNPKEAIRNYENSIRFNYRLSDAYYNCGLYYSNFNDSIALSYFEKSLPINSDRLKVIHEIKECKKRIISNKIKQFPE